jgi:transcriptional regulator NrdR family protein
MKTRKNRLREKITFELNKAEPSIDYILSCVDEYEQFNLLTIKKLKRKKEIDTRKINGAIKQTINAHGPITKDLISSATKRIYGALLTDEKENIITKIIKSLKWTKNK